MIYSQKTAILRSNISVEERQKMKKLQAKKQTQWMIAGAIR